MAMTTTTNPHLSKREQYIWPSPLVPSILQADVAAFVEEIPPVVLFALANAAVVLVLEDLDPMVLQLPAVELFLPQFVEERHVWLQPPLPFPRRGRRPMDMITLALSKMRRKTSQQRAVCDHGHHLFPSLDEEMPPIPFVARGSVYLTVVPLTPSLSQKRTESVGI